MPPLGVVNMIAIRSIEQSNQRGPSVADPGRSRTAVEDKSAASDVSATSLTLLERIKARDNDGWNRLVKLYGPLIYKWCRSSGLSESDAIDCVQEVLRSVDRTVDRFRRDRPGDSFRNWLKVITANKVRDHLRLQRRQPRASGGTTAFLRLSEQPAPLDDESIEIVTDADQDRLVLTRKLMALVKESVQKHTWAAFWMTAVEGKSPSDVAEELVISVWTVYQARSRVLRRLRDEASGLLDEHRDS